MSTVILDLSSGNTCCNDKTIVKQMINAIKAIDTGKHEIILKAQLSLPDGINLPLDHDVFDYMYRYGNEQGYKVTSSVADLESLKFLLQYDVPFVKLPNDRKLDWLIDYISRGMLIYKSVEKANVYDSFRKIVSLYCISKYPATLEDYELLFKPDYGILWGDKHHCESDIKRRLIGRNIGISDHTIGLELYKKYQPAIWEKHFKLPDSTGPDAGEFAITPDELREIL